MGFNEIALKWMYSYLTGREQIVDVNGSVSKPCKIPQGSIWGPVLFLLYVNDMKSAVTCNLLSYADDSALLVSDKCVSKIENVLSE